MYFLSFVLSAYALLLSQGLLLLCILIAEMMNLSDNEYAPTYMISAFISTILIGFFGMGYNILYSEPPTELPISIWSEVKISVILFALSVIVTVMYTSLTKFIDRQLFIRDIHYRSKKFALNIIHFTIMGICIILCSTLFLTYSHKLANDILENNNIVWTVEE